MMGGKQGKLLVISGLSGAGKGTIADMLVRDSGDFVLSISATSRDRRANEIEGKHYFFVTKEKFEEMIKNGDLLEYANYVGNFYGTPKKFVLDKLSGGKNVILEIEMQGALKIKEIMKDALLIFIMPKDAHTQYERLVSRNRETKEQIIKRLNQAIIDSTYADKYDYIVVNDDINNTLKDVKDIIDEKYDKSKNKENLKLLDKLVEDIKENRYERG